MKQEAKIFESLQTIHRNTNLLIEYNINSKSFRQDYIEMPKTDRNYTFIDQILNSQFVSSGSCQGSSNDLLFTIAGKEKEALKLKMQYKRGGHRTLHIPSIKKIFIIGGFCKSSAKSISKCEVYDASTNQFSEICELPQDFYRFGAFSDQNNGIVTFGGYVQNVFEGAQRDEILKYDIVQNS